MKEVYGGVRQVTLTAADLTSSRAFYADRLGFSVIDEEPGRFVRINLGTFRLRIVGPGPDGPTRPGTLTFTFRVAHLRRTAEELERRSVGFESESMRNGTDQLITHDPDGVRLVFVERL